MKIDLSYLYDEYLLVEYNLHNDSVEVVKVISDIEPKGYVLDEIIFEIKLEHGIIEEC